MEARAQHEIRKISYKRLHILCELNILHVPLNKLGN
jgi:hypothetical protein